MVEAILDTTVLVDILRGYDPGIDWGKSNANRNLGVTPIIWLELLAGTRNKVAQNQALELLSQFEMIYLTQADQNWAVQQNIKHRLSHNVGMMDCLIAAPAQRLQLPLYTRNLKHRAPLLGDLAQQAY